MQAIAPSTSSAVPVEIDGQAGTTLGTVDEDEDDDDEVGPTLDIGGDGQENGSNKRRKKKAGETQLALLERALMY